MALGLMSDRVRLRQLAMIRDWLSASAERAKCKDRRTHLEVLFSHLLDDRQFLAEIAATDPVDLYRAVRSARDARMRDRRDDAR